MVNTSVQSPSIDRLNRLAGWILKHWLLMLNVMMGIYVLTPFTAPIFMRLGWVSQSRAIYMIYSTQCHQLPQRSFFLFGEHLTYSLPEINIARGSTEFLTLREFIGNDQMGYKVAWSDRMISLYTSIWIGSLLYALLRRRTKPMPFLLAAALLVPIFIDGGTHLIADFQGFGQGFRDTNIWLSALTWNALPSTFYAGDGWGSFNSVMRLVTGLMAGIALAWVILPRIDPLITNDRR